jgi:type IV secretory pathway VirB4 component
MQNENKDITYFGETTWRNDRQRFGIKQADRLMHTYIIGKTGTGKSTCLET